MENEQIKRYILELYAIHDKRLGVLKTRELLRDYGINISAGRVYRLMKTMLLPTINNKKPKPYHSSSHIYEGTNHLQQQFKQHQPNAVWVSDITYIRVASRWCYLCVIIDLYSRKVIAHKLENKANTQLVVDCFNDALMTRRPSEGLMFHSDRGTQYTATQFRNMLTKNNIVQSFSKKGHPYDNACMEAFFKYLKLEETNRRTYSNKKEAALSIFGYINYYNSKRPHSTNDYLTPNAKEKKYYNN